MVVIVCRNGVLYQNATVLIPLALKSKAKEKKLSLSVLLAEAIEEKLAEVDEVDSSNANGD